MISTHAKSFHKLESSKNNLLSSLAGLSSEQLNYKVESDKWSITQILYHMEQVEYLSLEYMKKKICDPQLRSVTMRDKMNMILLKFSLWLPLKFKAPGVVSDSIPDESDLPSLAEEWANRRKDLEQFLYDLPKEVVGKKIFKHPRVGMLTIEQTLKFFQFHFNHHLPQIDHLSKTVRKQTT